MINFSSSMSEKVSPQVNVKKEDLKISKMGLPPLNRQHQRRVGIKDITLTSSSSALARCVKRYSAKNWMKAGLVVGTTALVYGVAKTLRYFPGWFEGRNNSQQDISQTNRGTFGNHRRKVAQQDQQTVEQHMSCTNAGISLEKQSNILFEELEISNVEIPKRGGHRANDSLEIDPEKVKYATRDSRLLQAPVVQNPIPDQEITIGTFFNLSLRNVFSDADGDFLTLSVRLSTGDPLPSWLSFSFTPFLLGSYDTPNLARDVIVSGTTAVVVDDPSGLQILDVSDLSHPAFLGSYNTTNSAFDGAVSGTTAYIADRSGGLQIVNISNPNNSTFLGSYDTGDARRVTISGAMAFVADIVGGLQIVNISDPSNPTFLGSYDTPGTAFSVAVSGAIAFVADWDSGLQIVNISDPSNPTFLGSYDTPGSAYDLTIKGTTVFVADRDSGLQIIDVSDPSNPTLVGFYDTPSSAFSSTIIGTTAFVADDYSGLQIIDVSDLSNPTLIGFYDTSGRATVVTVRDTTAFVADYTSGLEIIDIGGWLLLGTPTSALDVGNYNIIVTATDGVDSIEDSFALTVTNAIPVVTMPLSDQTTVVGEVFSFQFSPTAFSDGDGHTLSYTATLEDNSVLPSWLSFDGATRTFSGTPGPDDQEPLLIKVTADDGFGGIATDTFALTVTNRAPSIDSPLSDQTTVVGEVFSFQFSPTAFSDDDGHALSYTATLEDNSVLPSWLSFDGATRTFSGTPGPDDQEPLLIKVTADDGFGGIATDTFALTVTNRAPSIDSPLSDQTTVVGEVFSFQFSPTAFSDGDGHTLSYTATLEDNSVLPSWLSFDGATQTFSGTPVSGNQGILSIKVTADDGFGKVAEDVFSLTVTNRAPAVDNPMPDQSIVIGQSYLYQFPDNTFGDRDLDTLTYTATLENENALPAWLTFTKETRTFSGRPGPQDQGVLNITVTASDLYGASVADTFELSVDSSATDFPPTLALPIPDQLANINQGFSFTFDSETFVDRDNDLLSYEATQNNRKPLPGWLNFDGVTRTFSGAPTKDDIGEVEILVTATDPDGLTAIATFRLSVINTENFAPIVSNPIPKQIADVGKDFHFTIPDHTFSDPNGDTLSYSVSTLPKWLNFDPETRTFSGTPGRGDTDTYADRDHPIEIMATDGQFLSSTTFVISVSGISSVELGVKILVPLISAFSVIYGAYKKRGVFINRFKKERYMKPEERILCGEEYERELNVTPKEIKEVMATIKDEGWMATLYSSVGTTKRKRLPGKASLPAWLKYDLHKNALIGTPIWDDQYSNLTIHVLGEGGIIKEQFDLTVEQRLLHEDDLEMQPLHGV